MQRFRYHLALAVSLVVLPAMAVHPVPVSLVQVSLAPRRAAAPYQVGMASWYGAWFQGKETTSGEPFNMDALTAAHRQLPLGTRVRVTNLLNQRSVVLRINDRGPVPTSRCLDVSLAAARALGFVGAGLAPVRIDVVPAAPVPAAPLPQLAER
ncbi:MAG TPA: septal ring lytic transglycosylase RlpA family protein [Terriglobales bacterium]|jgi:rare lipoprotein A